MSARPPLGALGPLFQAWAGSPAELVEAAQTLPGHRWLRGSRMRTREGFMDEWAAAAQFPPHFGGTWDALRDALADLPEGGTFLVLEADQVLQEAPPREAQAWVAVMRAVAADLDPKPFRVVLQTVPDRLPDLRAGLRGLGVS